MSVHIIRKRAPVVPQHVCELPNHKMRKQMAIQMFDVVECDDAECKQRYQFVRRGLELGGHWEPVK